jgi:hypothetical protein
MLLLLACSFHLQADTTVLAPLAPISLETDSGDQKKKSTAEEKRDGLRTRNENHLIQRAKCIPRSGL